MNLMEFWAARAQVAVGFQDDLFLAKVSVLDSWARIRI